MSIAESLLPEFDREIATTRRVLERVPEAKLDWAPHEKSMTLRRLASHLAEIPSWGAHALNADELDLAPPGGEPMEPRTADSVAEMLSMLDASAANTRQAIEAAPDAEFSKPWTLKHGGETIFTAPKIGVVRDMVMNHMIHHRGQLSVYLRLTGARVPSIYGPSADEDGFGAES